MIIDLFFALLAVFSTIISAWESSIYVISFSVCSNDSLLKNLNVCFSGSQNGSVFALNSYNDSLIISCLVSTGTNQNKGLQPKISTKFNLHPLSKSSSLSFFFSQYSNVVFP